MESSLRSNFQKNIIWIVMLALIAFLSCLFISPFISDPSRNATTIKALDEKRAVVLQLATVSVATSTGLTLLPGDIATPIANQLAELSKWFLLILSVLFFEKVLLSIVGYISFTFIIPIACFLGIVFFVIQKKTLLNIAIKLAIYGLIISIAIPAGMKMGDLIYASNEFSVEAAVNMTENNKALIDEQGEDILKEEKTLLEKVTAFFSDAPAKIGSGVTDAIKKGEDSFNAALDAIATLIITTLVIPLLVMLLIVWITKLMLNSLNFNLPEFDLSKFRMPEKPM